MSESMLQINYRDLKSLYQAYMPFITQGALFIPTEQTYVLQETLTLQITLPNQTTTYRSPGRVIWITPRHAQGHRTPGVGIQLLESEGQALKTQIDSLLKDYSETGNTETL